MADFERLIISKILDEGNLTPVLSAGVKPAWFEDEEHERAFVWMTEYFTNYSETPTERAFKRQFPTYRLAAVDEPYEYYIDNFRNQRRRGILVDTVVDADQALRMGDLSAAQSSISSGLMRVGREVSSLKDENAVGKGKLTERYEYYRAQKYNTGLKGIPTGFSTLDLISGGWQRQQFILFGGSPKQSKSFLLMHSAIAAQDFGKEVLFVSFEMSKDEQLARYDAVCGSVNARKLLAGDYSEEEWNAYRKRLSLRRNMKPFWISADTAATLTVSGLAGKIEEKRPDIVFIDGVYLMENEEKLAPQSAQAFTSISRGLKRLAQRIDKPLIGTIQALTHKMRDGKVSMHSLGYSSAWAQDADLILGVEKEPGTSTVRLRVVAGRTISSRVITIRTDFETSTFEEVDMGEEDDEENSHQRSRSS
jgi:hypothetical protein